MSKTDEFIDKYIIIILLILFLVAGFATGIAYANKGYIESMLACDYKDKYEQNYNNLKTDFYNNFKINNYSDD